MTMNNLITSKIWKERLTRLPIEVYEHLDADEEKKLIYDLLSDGSVRLRAGIVKETEIQ